MPKFERAEISKFEFAETKNHYDFTYILASSIPNLNGWHADAEALESAKETIINEPLIIVPDWDNLPTGHSLAKFPALDYDAKIIGTHIAAETFEEDGITHLKTTARVWKIRHPLESETMKSLHEAGALRFSMEAAYDEAGTEGTTRKAKNVKFIGSAVVDDPANPFSYSLEVANRKKQEQGGSNSMFKTLDEAVAHIGGLNVKLENAETKLATANKTIETLTGEKSTLAETLETANKNVDKLTAEVKTLTEEKETAAKAKLAGERFAEMAEYVTYTEAEKTETASKLGEMSEEVYGLVLETAKRNGKKDGKTEVAGVSSDTKLNLDADNPLAFLD
ncbi:hypothetical protein PP657_gp084 [Bacillus phage BCPST]|uniref:Uncharacterized protein n=1 Tax=Bacillus phage BCPST TaxID=2801506 RepID=A0AAE7P3K9_9CAUD|nr:hypothetical protein PP657_gp084 [Bacillus phage BCPST]QQO38702.1 hypothetical protein BCPST_084 [Bacillus phage BCPST]QSJ04292.1 hypothetical protein BCP6_087 [Bacillus phage BCP6]